LISLLWRRLTRCGPRRGLPKIAQHEERSDAVLGSLVRTSRPSDAD
jgi:hypothetical protein